MPAIIFSCSVGRASNGVGYVSINSVSSVRFTSYSYELEDTNLGSIDSGPIDTTDLPLRIYKPGGVYSLTVIDEVTGQRSNPQTVTIPGTNTTPPTGTYTMNILVATFQKKAIGGYDVKIYFETTQPGGYLIADGNSPFGSNNTVPNASPLSTYIDVPGIPGTLQPGDTRTALRGLQRDGAGITWLQRAGNASPLSTYIDVPGIPGALQPGDTRTITLQTTQGGAALASLTFTVPIYGCTDPGADNYNPNATAEDFSCYFTPRVFQYNQGRVLIGGEAPLYACFSERVLSQQPGQPAARPASAFINLESMGSQVVTLTINGYRYRSGPPTDPSNFQDAPTLVQVLKSNPVLAAAYEIRQSQDEEVKLTARAVGTPGNLTITTSDAGAISVVTVPGINRHFSQGVYDWGIYCEVWALPAQPFGNYTMPSSGAVLAMPRMELPAAYDANDPLLGGNHGYYFDIAPALRQFTGHTLPNYYGVAAGRTIAYYLVFGEIYADTPVEVRRVRTTYNTISVQFAYDAVEPPRNVEDEDTGVGGAFLTSRPSPWRVRPSGHLPGLYLLPFDELGNQSLVVTARNWAGDEMEESCIIQNDTTGVPGYVRPATNVSAAVWASLRDNLWLPAGEGFTTGKLEIYHANYDARLLVATLSFTGFDDTSPVLHIVNTMGGIDPVLFEGAREDSLKRTASTYQNGRGTQLLSAEAALPFRLYTGPLDRATWDWLRQQLAVSPRVWLEETPGAEWVEVRVTDLDPVSDHIKGEYSLSVELEKQPLKGIIN